MKKGILAVSFGTSHIDTMEKTIDVLEKEFAKTFEEAVVYRAFTSNMIIKKLKRTANIKVQTVGEALEKMAADGIEEVIEHMHLFRKVYVGKPLLSSVEDYKKAIHAVMEKTVIGEDEMLVLMGHGTDHHANSAYPTLEYTFHSLGYQQVLVGPLMLVAGDHARNDMAGEEDSWKSELEEKGYEVRVILKGLGEFEGIRKIFAEHIEEAEM